MITKQTRWIAVVALAAILCAVVATQAHAQAVGQHPALGTSRAAPTIDPNTFIVAHPAQVTLKGGHAGHQHPALSARHALAGSAIDANHFLVQPPASTTWTHDAAAVVFAGSGQR